MEISSELTGTPLKEFSTEISWRHTTNYAAAIQDSNPRYFDDERPDGLLAPPMFSVAVTWPVLERLWDFIELDHFPREILTTQVHYSEHLRFHAPLRPGIRVRIRGKIAAILPHRAGTHMVIRLDAEDQDGNAIFTEHIGGMMRGVRCLGEGAGKKTLPGTPESVGPAEPVWHHQVHIDPLLPYVYDGCSDIVFPIHTSPGFARQAGLPGIILQGTATLALAAREIVNREADGNPERLKELSCRFTGMVIPGTMITIQFLGSAKRKGYVDLFFQVLNHQGQKALSRGYAIIGV
ncbi:MAG: MaoC family dehydratase N-terminal domain-containing protein [Deltaproteobacteria bacterium]|nr:MaoC family dehydratase N-terminal domain-containing protein [Deltaproteobacteria bacterium]